MAETTIRADGKSPLSCYVDLLVSVPANLELLLDRDAEAVRILTATPALPEAIRRAERWYWDRQREKQTGGIVLTRRIWTRRDERRVNMLRRLSEGWWPPCRAARYLDRLQPRSGASSHDKWFRSAVDEARRDGTAAVLCPKLEQAKAIYERLISAARSVAQDDGGRGDFDSAKIELGSLACELMNWTKQPGSSNSTPARLDVGDIQRQIAEGFQAAQAGLAGRDITDTIIEAGNAAQGDVEAEAIPAESDVAHSTDFRSVRWFGERFTFTTTQAACVQVLWRNWQQGTPVISEVTVLDDAGSAGDRLRDVFDKGKHPAWGTLIKPAGKGAFCLAEPDES